MDIRVFSISTHLIYAEVLLDSSVKNYADVLIVSPYQQTDMAIPFLAEINNCDDRRETAYEDISSLLRNKSHRNEDLYGNC